METVDDIYEICNLVDVEQVSLYGLDMIRIGMMGPVQSVTRVVQRVPQGGEPQVPSNRQNYKSLHNNSHKH